MADCTVKVKPYGYWCGNTGTDATSVVSGPVQVKKIICCCVASASSLLVTDTSGDNIINFESTPSGLTQVFDIGGKRFDGLKVTLVTSTVDRVLILTE